MFSAGAGAPMLCLPNGRDQDDNAARVQALGLGRALSPEAAPCDYRRGGDGDACGQNVARQLPRLRHAGSAV
jgi:hypothetical protein